MAGSRKRVSGADYRPAVGGLTREGSWFETAKRNLDIIDLARKIEAENRPATPEEQALLSKYVGFGAGEIRNNLFPVPTTWQKQQAKPGSLIFPEATNDARWKALAERAAALPEEWQRTILQSTQYAHYTSENVIRSIWSAVQRLGFTGGKIFEPGAGIGSFAMLMPEPVHETSTYTGIEFDGPTALVAKLLSPQQRVLHADFIKRSLPDDFFDVAVGNPPFAAVKVTSDPRYQKNGFLLHDYFFAKTIDKVRPGGLLAFVTSKGTMDKKTDKARRYLMARADFLGAIRLPSTAFEANAGTSVVTDVIFLRKRAAGEAPAGLPWGNVETVETPDGPIVINEYFASHPEMVLGQNRISGNIDDEGRRINSNGIGGEKYTVVSYDKSPEELDAKFAAAVEKLPSNVYSTMGQPAEEIRQETTKIDFDPKSKKEGSVYVSNDGTLMRVKNGVGTPLGDDVRLSEKDQAWFKGYVGLRDLIQQARYAQLTDGEWEKGLKALNKAYDAFVKEHGPINAYRTQVRKSTDAEGNEVERSTRVFTNRRLLREDYEAAAVMQLEVIDEDGNIQKSKFLKERTIGKPVTRNIQTIGDALAVSLDNIGKLNVADIAQRMKMSLDEAIEALGNRIYRTPAGEWQLSDEYLSGNVVEKLRAAEEAAAVDPSFERNVKALQEVQPEKLGPSQIGVKAGAGWVPVRHMNEFATEIGAGRVSFDTKTETWSVEGAGERSGRSAADEFGTSERSPSDLLQAVLNSRSIKITKTIKDGSSTKTVTDVDATTAANDVAKKIKEKFKSWVWTDTDRAADLVEAYNDRYNTLAPRVFDGSHLSLPGLSLRFKLHPHQLRAIWRQIQTGNTYLAHAVGAGKTIEMIAGGMEQKRLGLIKKPMYVVPNHMLEQFANEFMELYPLANIMVADDKNFSADKRKAFVAAASMNAPDAIVITHSAFELIGVKEESIAPIRDEILDDLEAELADAAKNKGDRVRRSQLQRQVEAVTQRFDSILAAGKKDNIVSFEDMGVDFVYVDEAHTHRKLDFNTEQKIKGIDPNGSRRALDMYVKTRWLESQRPGRSMVFASGTPVTNTMGELYTIMRFFAQKALDEGGISTFDSWSRMFGETVAALEPNAAGKYEVVERFARFDNVPELMSRIRMFMDVLQSDQLGAVVTRPEVRGGKPEMVIVEPTKALLDYQENVLNTRLQESRKWKPTKDEPNNPDPVIAIISDGRFAAVDPRFFGGKILPGETTKIDAAADKIIAEYAATSDNVYVDRDAKPMANKGGTQIVFYNTGFGASAQENRGFNARAALTKRLVDGGIPKKQIAWFDDADTDAKKEEIFKGMRNGTYRVLIGSAKKMGTGVNVQNRLTALHYIDPPWFPADVEQPRGRIIRQGNQNKIVGEFWYATKGGYDSTMWQMVARKQRFIDQAFSGDKNMRSMEDLGEASLYEQAAALASGDPRAIQLAGLKQDVERLERQHSAHATEQLKAREALRNETAYLHNAETAIEKLAAALEALGTRHFRFDGGKVGETTHETQTDFGQAIKTAFNEYITTDAGMRGRKKLLGSLSDSVKIYAGGSSAFGAKDGALDLYVQVGNYKVDSVVWDNTDGLDENVDALGLARKIINAVNGIDGSKERAEKARNEAATNIIRLKKKIGAPFEHGQEMLEKHAALKALEEELRQEGLASNAPEGGPTEEEMSQALDAGAEIDAPLYSRQPAAGSQPSPALHAAVVSGDAGRVLSELRNDLERAGDEFGVLVVDRLSTLDRGPLSFSYSGGEKRLNSYSPLYHLIRLYDGYSAHALLHELVHAFTAHAYKSANAKERARIDAVYEAARAAGADDYHYGLTSVDEFMAEVFSNRDFRDFLKSVPYQKTTLWGGFVQAVRRLLGFPAEQTSALDEAIDAIDSEIFARNTNGAVASRFHATPLRMAENATPAPEKAPPPYKSPTDTIAGVDTGKYGFDYADVLGDKSPDSRLRRLSEILYENREGTEIEGILSDPADKAASVGEIYDELAWLRDTAVDLGNLPQWGDANFSPEDFPGNVNSARAARLLMTDADVARLARNGGTAGSGTLYSRLSSTPASRGTNGQGLPLGQVQRLATTFARKLGVDPARVVVLRSADEIGAPAEYTTKGAYDSNTDTVYLFADALDDADDARRVLLHEIVGHKGVRAAVGDGWTGVRQRLEQGRAGDRGIADLFERVAREEAPGLDADGVAEEVIARAAERYGAAGPLHWRRILGAIRAALRRLGLVSDGYSLNEVVDLLAAGRRAVRAESATGAEVLPGEALRFSRAINQAAQAAGQQPLVNKAKYTIQNLRTWLSNTGPLSSLPQVGEYLQERYRTLGKIANVDEIAKGINAAFAPASDAGKEQVYRFLTTKGASAAMIADAKVRAEAVRVKRMISEVGQRLVDRGMLPQEVYEANDGGYLPRVYLRHVIGESAFAALGTGRKPSSLGYLKARQDIPEEVRRLVLGEITDPGFLAARGWGVQMRDIAILDWIGEIAKNRAWVLDRSLVQWQGKRVTPYWLKDEAARIRRQSTHYTEADRAQARQLADKMDDAANAALSAAEGPEVPDGYKQMPKSARYGALRGMVVRQEIYDDIVGSMQADIGDKSMAERILGNGGLATKLTQLWKWGKVAANPPAQIRNFLSNGIMLHLSGVPFHRVPQRIVQAIREIRTNGHYWQVAKRYGVTESTFAAQELFRIERDLLEATAARKGGLSLDLAKLWAGRVMDWTGDVYQLSEAVFKTAKIIDAMQRQKLGEADAALEAQKWLFDYSLVSPSVRYLRNAPVGAPFLTFYVKAIPRLAEVALTHPLRFAPYVAIPYVLAAMLASMTGTDDDDVEALKRALPQWLQDRGNAWILPAKDENGRWQALDVSYFMPWSMLTQFASAAARGDAGDALSTSGLLGGPLPDLIAAIKTNKDPFTQKPIANPADPAARQLGDIMLYAWRMAMPTFITDIGAAGHLYRAVSGEDLDRYGEPKSTVAQAAARLFGANVYPINPEHTREQNIAKMQREISDTRRVMRQKMRDPNLDEAQRKALREEYVAEIRRRNERLRDYARESRVHPNLRTGTSI